mgnify:CR=1 FL=1
MLKVCGDIYTVFVLNIEIEAVLICRLGALNVNSVMMMMNMMIVVDPVVDDDGFDRYNSKKIGSKNPF